MASNWIHFYKTDFSISNWDIVIQMVGQGYIPYTTEKNKHAVGRHVMDDFGNLIQALPKDLHSAADDHLFNQYVLWGSYGVDDSYFCH